MIATTIPSLPAQDSLQAPADTEEAAESETSADATPAGADLQAPDKIRDDTEIIETTLTEMPDEIAEAARQAYAQFMSTKTELREQLAELREIQIRYMNDLDRSPSAKKSYQQLRQTVATRLRAHFDEAIQVIRLLPSSEAASYLVTMVQHLYEIDDYTEASYEAATRLLDLGQRYAYLFLMGARSGVVTGRFEEAKRIYDSIDPSALSETDQRLVMSMDIIEQQYKRDLELRQQIDESSLPTVELETTKGRVTITLFTDSAPSAAEHFMRLVEDGFYDGLDFAQVLDGVLALTGDPTNDGRGNSGNFLIDEHDRENARPALRGSVIMAKMPLQPGEFVPNSGSSQFAIALLPLPSVASTQTVFGQVTDGMHVISSLRRVDPSEKKSEKEIQFPPDAILTATVVQRGPELPEPNYVDIQAELAKARAAGLIAPLKTSPSETRP
ncbi:MAG: peptidylprolyl isomerase [Planctomycetota bacterium]